MEKSPAPGHSNELVSREQIQSAFATLPPLGSPEFIERVKTAQSEELPPEVLARAYRQLPAGCEASQITLKRLLNVSTNGQSEYLRPLISRARRLAGRRNPEDYKDYLQDTLTRILRLLPTDRGKYAEQSWHAFCIARAKDAWRERNGRRGERKSLENELDENSVGENGKFPGFSNRADKRGFVPPDQVERIESVRKRVLSGIRDSFIREVAEAAWSADKRPKQSGDSNSSLKARFPKKSRDQIGRALRYADAQLAAALLNEPHFQLEEIWQLKLEAIVEKAAPPLRRDSGRKK
jgi:hypothetical protein